MLPITSLTAGALTLLLLVLTVLVSKQRGKVKVSLGDGGDKTLLKRIRAFGNFTEYAPIGLILLALIEYNGVSAMIVWTLALLLLGGRLLHALGMYVKPLGLGRLIGMILNYVFFLVSAGLLIGGAF